MSVIIDAGPLIKNTSLPKYSLVTVPQVLREVRDRTARQALSTRLETISTTQPTEEDVSFASNFAKETGDFPSLSENDILLLALAVKLYRESGRSLSRSPSAIQTSQNRAHGWDNEWASPDIQLTQESPIYLMTFDFSVQNVALQMGVKLLSVKGFEIKYIKRWVLKCNACSEITENVEKEFCSACGNHVLSKVSYSVGSDGQVQYYEGKKKHGTRGTVYPIPLPKVGKHSNNVILREDELYLMSGRQNKWNWKKQEVYDSDSAEAFGFTLGKKCPYKFGPGKKNPNEVTRKRRNN